MKFPLKKDLVALAQKYHLRVLILFGSHAHGIVHRESDLDLAFFSYKSIDEEKLLMDLMKLFHRADIDLINLYHTHNHILRYQVLSTGKTLYEAEKGLKNRMEWQSYFDYMDFQKYYRERGKLLDQKIQLLAV